MAQPAKAQEPSMEEILASIRRIIADDESKSKSAEPPKPAPPPPPRPEPSPLRPAAAAPQPAAARTPMNQEDIDSMLANIDAPPGPGNGQMPEADVLELTEKMAASSEPPVFRTIEGRSDVFFSEENAEPTPEAAPGRSLEEVPQPGDLAQQAPLISSATRAAVDSAFNSLAHTVLAQNARTLEDLVKEMMRPMLKAWLDDNLPNLVERVVRAEIERVSRGRGS
jgi:uncharacterized protein